jgi:hypothetical protein
MKWAQVAIFASVQEGGSTDSKNARNPDETGICAVARIETPVWEKMFGDKI